MQTITNHAWYDQMTRKLQINAGVPVLDLGSGRWLPSTHSGYCRNVQNRNSNCHISWAEEGVRIMPDQKGGHGSVVDVEARTGGS